MATQAIKSAAAPRAFRLAPGLIFVVVIFIIAAYSLSLQFPRWVAPAGVPYEVFSAERALAHLPVIAGEPHPAGSPAQARVGEYLSAQVSALNLEASPQPFQSFQNIAARLPGSDSTGAIVVLAHYDSVPGSPGAADNGSGVAVLLEVMRSLASGQPLRNDVIILFDDAEEGSYSRPPFAGARAFAQSHPWMADVRMAISLDTAVAGPIQVNDTTSPDGRLVGVLADVYRSGWTWASFGGDGTYDNAPFRELGIQSLALEDNYAFRVQHTPLDQIENLRIASMQQLGDQTLAIVRRLGMLDLRLDPGADQTFLYVPLLGLFHYPRAWTVPLAGTTAALLIAILAFALRRKIAAWRGMAAGFAAALIAILLSALVVGAIWSLVPELLGWQVAAWPEWPEVVPPGAGWILAGFAAVTILIAAAIYRLARRWSSRAEFALAAFIPVAIMAVALAAAEPRLAILPTWLVLLGSLVWLAFLAIPRLRAVPLDWPAWLTAAIGTIHWPAVLLTSYLSSGPSDVALLAVLWAMYVLLVLPAAEGAVEDIARTYKALPSPTRAVAE